MFALVLADGGAVLLHVRAGASAPTSAVVAIVTGLAVSYAGNRYWTFRHRRRPGIRPETIRYITLYVTGLAIQVSCLAVTVDVLGYHGMPAYEAAAGIGTGLFRFWCCRQWVWPRRRAVTAATFSVMS